MRIKTHWSNYLSLPSVVRSEQDCKQAEVTYFAEQKLEEKWLELTKYFWLEEMLTLPNVSTAGHAQALAVTVKPQSVGPAVSVGVRQSAGQRGPGERQCWSWRFTTENKGLSHIVEVQSGKLLYKKYQISSLCSAKDLSTNLRASEISSMNLSQLEKFIQRFVLHICFHMMVVSTVLRVRPSIIRAWRDHPYIIFILKQRSGWDIEREGGS